MSQATAWWDSKKLGKARCFELVKLLSQHLSKHYPWLMGCNISQVLARLSPVRRSQDNRMVRFFGRDCLFPDSDQARVAGFLLDQFFNATGQVNQATIVVHCDLPPRRKVSDVLRHTFAYQEGLIASNGQGLYGWKIPQDEQEKPPLVIIPKNK